MSSQIAELKSNDERLESAMKELKEENRQLANAVNSLEQYSRKNNVIINGIPYTQDEDIRKVVKNLIHKLGVDINLYNICAAHRLPTRDNKTPAVIVQFNDNEIKKVT